MLVGRFLPQLVIPLLSSQRAQIWRFCGFALVGETRSTLSLADPRCWFEKTLWVSMACTFGWFPAVVMHEIVEEDFVAAVTITTCWRSEIRQQSEETSCCRPRPYITICKQTRRAFIAVVLLSERMLWEIWTTRFPLLKPDQGFIPPVGPQPCFELEKTGVNPWWHHIVVPGTRTIVPLGWKVVWHFFRW